MDHEQRQQALAQARRAGREAPQVQRRRQRSRWVASWLRIARLQFYAMTLLAYGLGALAAVRTGEGIFSASAFVLGFVALFLLEFGSVLLNEFHDQETDRRNANPGPFNGGSQVLVQQRLDARQVRRVARAVVTGSAVAALAALLLSPRPLTFEFMAGPVILLLIGYVLGPGYTAPPLKLVYRGAGEFVVAFTHSVFMTASGWMLMGGGLGHGLPYLLSLPMALAIFGAIALAGIPDAEADGAVHKRTIAVRTGCRTAALVALAAALLASPAMLLAAAVIPDAGLFFQGLFLPALAHAALLTAAIARFLRRGARCVRIDGVLFLALAYVLWFSLGPLVKLF